MGFDFGHLIALIFILYIVAISYKKKTGKNIGEIWKNWKANARDFQERNEYRKVYITKGVKQ